jgi:hypothetical protein
MVKFNYKIQCAIGLLELEVTPATTETQVYIYFNLKAAAATCY